MYALNILLKASRKSTFKLIIFLCIGYIPKLKTISVNGSLGFSFLSFLHLIVFCRAEENEWRDGNPRGYCCSLGVAVTGTDKEMASLHVEHTVY